MCCKVSAGTLGSVERLELVRFDRCLVLMEVCQRIFCTIVVSIVVGINGLCFQTCDGIKLLDGGGTQACQGTEHCAFDLSHLSVFHCVHQGVLRLGSMVLQFLGCVFLTERRNLVEIHLKIVGHLLGELILRRLLRSSLDELRQKSFALEVEQRQ